MTHSNYRGSLHTMSVGRIFIFYLPFNVKKFRGQLVVPHEITWKNSSLVDQLIVYQRFGVFEFDKAFDVFLHTEKYFLNRVKSNQNQIVFTIFPLIWNQTELYLVPNQSENVNYNLIMIWFNNIQKINIPCTCMLIDCLNTFQLFCFVRFPSGRGLHWEN